MHRPNIQTPNVRGRDPLPSIKAAKYLAPLRSKKQAAVLAMVKRYPGRTAWELAQNAAIRKTIKTLKFVARHYKKQRDQVDAYLSVVLDLTLAKPEQAETEGRTMAFAKPLPLPGGAGGDRMITSKPGRERIAWEDF